MLSDQEIAEGWLPQENGITPESAVSVLFASGLVRHIYDMIHPWPPSRNVIAYKPEPKP